MPQPELSIIVPAYNEEELIVSTITAIQQFLKGRHESYELIVVDDGSQDKTAHLVDEMGAGDVTLRLLVNEHNMGKGFSVRRGVEESRGRYLIFMDADLPYELDAIDGFLHALGNGSDLAVGSRVLPGSEVKDVPALRFFAGQVFSRMVQVFLFLDIRDTQCGFKSFRAEAAREVFRRLTIGGFGFDAELLYIASKLKYRVQSVAVRMLHHRVGSRVRLLSHSLEMFNDLFAIRLNDLRGKYR